MAGNDGRGSASGGNSTEVRKTAGGQPLHHHNLSGDHGSSGSKLDAARRPNLQVLVEWGCHSSGQTAASSQPAPSHAAACTAPQLVCAAIAATLRRWWHNFQCWCVRPGGQGASSVPSAQRPAVHDRSPCNLEALALPVYRRTAALAGSPPAQPVAAAPRARRTRTAA